MQKPDVDGIAIKEFLKFGCNQRQKLLHVERGRECFLEVVELRQAGDRTERVVTLAFILLRRYESGSGWLRDFDERVERIGRSHITEAEYLQRADEIFAVH